MARTTIDELLARARASLERLEPEEALGAQRNGALLVDVRSDGERARHGVIPGSLHVPRTVLEWRLDPGSPHRNPDACDLRRHVVVVCADGYSSSLAAATLQELGYRRATGPGRRRRAFGNGSGPGCDVKNLTGERVFV